MRKRFTRKSTNWRSPFVAIVLLIQLLFACPQQHAQVVAARKSPKVVGISLDAAVHQGKRVICSTAIAADNLSPDRSFSARHRAAARCARQGCFQPYPIKETL